MASRKRLLVLTPRFPYPVIGGDRLRIAHVCRALAATFELTLLSLCETQEEMSVMPNDSVFKEIHRVLLPRWKSFRNVLLALPTNKPLQLAYYESPEFRRKVDSLLPEHDLALAHLIRTGQYIENQPITSILEMTDSISLNYGRIRQLKGAHHWKKLVYSLEQKRLNTYELNTISNFQRVWLTSETDREFLDGRHHLPIEVVPNGVDLDEFPFRTPAERGFAIVFIGNMVTIQNQDACHHFAQEILPKLRAHADVEFRIVGNAPHHVIRSFQRYSHVRMTGRVEHISDAIENAFCGVCPMRAEPVSRIKLLEYLALGLPCVTSAIGLEGISARPGEHLLTYRNSEEAARHILALYSDSVLRLRLAYAGHSLVAERYAWPHIYSQITGSAKSIMN